MDRRCTVAPVSIVVAALMAAGATVAGEGVFLGYDFSEDYRQEYKVKFNQEVDTGRFAFSQLIDMEVTEKCVGVEDSLFLMEMTFDKVESGRMQFDNMVDDPTGERLTGNVVTFKVDRFGETSQMKPVGYIEGWAQMERIIEAMIDTWYAYLPNETVDKGGTWTKEEGPKEESGMTVEGQSHYQFREITEEKDRECAKIEARSENKVSGTQDTAMGTMEVSGGGKGESELYFCLKSSTVVKYEAKVEMKMDMTPEGGGDAHETTVAFAMEREIK